MQVLIRQWQIKTIPPTRDWGIIVQNGVRKEKWFKSCELLVFCVKFDKVGIKNKKSIDLLDHPTFKKTKKKSIHCLKGIWGVFQNFRWNITICQEPNKRLGHIMSYHKVSYVNTYTYSHRSQILKISFIPKQKTSNLCQQKYNMIVNNLLVTTIGMEII